MTSPILALLSAAPAHDLTRHWAGYVALVVFGFGYLFVIHEEKLHLRKSKPVILAAGIIWMLIGVAYLRAPDAATVSTALRANVSEYAELFLFVLVAMTFVSLMEDRRLFDALRAWLIRKRLTFRAIFWLTGIMSFFLSSQLDNLTTALVMGTVVVTVGRGYPKFIAVACVNVVVAANAGGAWSPFGDITTLMVWQAGKVGFFEFYALIIPSLVNWFIPAFCMQFAVPRVRPDADDDVVRIRRGGYATIALFAVTITLAVSGYNVLSLPPFIGMTTGLGLLMMYGYYMKKTHRPMIVPAEPALAAQLRQAAMVTATSSSMRPMPIRPAPVTPVPLPAAIADDEQPFDIFATVRKAEWDTLLFFYGIVLCVGGLAFLGYLHNLSNLLYHGWGATQANIAIGVISAVIDNIPVMFAVLSMDPAMTHTQWLLVTLTAGVGGSLLSVGSAAGVGLMGQSKGQYTFFSHLRWTWAIALGYIASIWVHLLIN